jgi:hypothetical protein
LNLPNSKLLSDEITRIVKQQIDEFLLVRISKLKRGFFPVPKEITNLQGGISPVS